ncbi:hypothetical protein [Kitasatospora sp. NPDC058190]|uniref:hypothetical protein n=1 Tax=Kitasatospora sp. NPDC058190 TaxID=3346371 RepID=UPI0036DD747B
MADQELVPGPGQPAAEQLTWPEIEEHRDYIKQLLETTTGTTIHQCLRDEQKLKASLASFRRWVQREPAGRGGPLEGHGAAG